MTYNNIYVKTDLNKIKNVSIILCINCLDNKYRILVGKLKKINLWTAPGGIVEDSEKGTDIGLFNAVCREFEEETGYNLTTIKMCYDKYFIFDRIHRNDSITRIYMNCTNINQFTFHYNKKTNTYKIQFGQSLKKDNEITELACYSLGTILQNKSKYAKYFINGLEDIKQFATELYSKSSKILILECGYLGQSSGYYHDIQNVILSKLGWSKVVIIENDVKIAEYNNRDVETTFKLVLDDEYNICLMMKAMNDIVIKKSPTLFKVSLEIYVINSDFKYRLEKDMIVDH